MPITDFQKKILKLISKHRDPNSYVAGGVAIHRDKSSLRYSNDIDFFHDVDQAVVSSSASDIDLLQKEGFVVTLHINQPSFVRAVVSKDRESLKLEWVRDSAFRFFPVVEDSKLGYRLHEADLAVNKCLALANRNEVRDIIDLIQLHQSSICFAVACWGACGKDPGFTPELLLDCMSRNSIIRPEQLSAESLTREITPTELKRDWLDLLSLASKTLAQLPPSELGCLYLDPTGLPLRSLNKNEIAKAQRHFGSVGGAWPRVIN